MPIHEGDYVDPERKKILDREKELKIPTPADFKSEASRKALYSLNKEAAEKASSKNDTAEEMAKKHEKDRKANPFVYKRGGFVKQGGMARVHTGERVLTKRQSKSFQRKRAVKTY